MDAKIPTRGLGNYKSKGTADISDSELVSRLMQCKKEYEETNARLKYVRAQLRALKKMNHESDKWAVDDMSCLCRKLIRLRSMYDRDIWSMTQNAQDRGIEQDD